MFLREYMTILDASCNVYSIFGPERAVKHRRVLYKMSCTHQKSVWNT